MKEFPEIKLMYSSFHGPVAFDEQRLEALLPLTRPSGELAVESGITYRAYLDAVEGFILANLARVREILSKDRTKADEISRVELIAEKHGSDYHPARVRIHSGDTCKSFVVNAALTERGRQRLTGDLHILDLLRGKFKRRFVPEVYFLEEANAERDISRPLHWKMFLGEWLEGFWEFHVSMHNGIPSLIVWDMDAGYTRMSESEAEIVYRRAAFILTYYYDLDSCEEIFPWHHAAGDFVVSRAGNAIEVKLVTVRQYASRWIRHESPSVDPVKALCLFFANLTVRMRLDRLDGVGDIVWAGPYCLNGTIAGFFHALREKTGERCTEGCVPDQFLRFLKGLSPVDLAELFQAVTDSYDKEAPDVPVILENLTDHILLVYQAIQQMPGSFIHPEN